MNLLNYCDTSEGLIPMSRASGILVGTKTIVGLGFVRQTDRDGSMDRSLCDEYLREKVWNSKNK